MSAQVVEDEDYQLRYEIVAGIDVAKESAVVCVRMPPAEGRKHRTSHLQTVPATVPAIGELAAELKAAGVQMVSMEATSDYWRIWFAVLEEAGLAVQLVNSAQARNLPGRPKTDKEDARWIARLTEMGMLRSSFVPPPEIRALRVYTRHICDLTADRTRHWQRLEKLLEDALCKLSARRVEARRAPDRPRGHRGDDRRGARPAGPGRTGPGQDAQREASRAGRVRSLWLRPITSTLAHASDPP
jgi:transposase